jgi:hypothetical protein
VLTSIGSATGVGSQAAESATADPTAEPPAADPPEPGAEPNAATCVRDDTGVPQARQNCALRGTGEPQRTHGMVFEASVIGVLP